ncbi:MAG: AMP-binding protein [Gemmataceae bacterium]
MTPSSVNVALHLARLAATEPDRPALHVPIGRVSPDGPSPHRAVSFARLNADADALAHGLAAAGVNRGDRVAVMVPPSVEFFALTFALLRRRAVPVLIDPGMGVKGVGKCLAEAEPAAFIGVPKAHLARRLFGWLRGRSLLTVNVGWSRFFCHRSLDELWKRHLGTGPWQESEPSPDETAAILFTSGSTGPAKGAVYTHGIFAAQVEMLKATYGIEPGEVDLCTFPLFALFGPALGMTCVIPDMDASRPATLDPRKAVAQVSQFGVTNLFGSPAVIRRLGDWGAQPLPPSPSPKRRGGASEMQVSEMAPPTDSGGAPLAPLLRFGEGDGGRGLPTLRRAISAGAPASAPAVERFAKLLPPGVELFTPYGATEALPVANIGSREILDETRHLTEQGKGVCVGRPVAGMTVHVIRISDDPIPEWDESLLAPSGEVGEFVVRGPVVTKQYFNRPDATRLAKITDRRTGEVLHRMGDVGYVDDRGRLWFCGRKSHRVVTPWGTLFTDMVEPVFNTLPGVSRTALVGVTRGGVTHPVLCVEPSGAGGNRTELTRSLLERANRFDHTRGVATFPPHPGFPVDVRHNSKIFREKLAVWADKKLGKNWNPSKAHGRSSVGFGGKS